MSRFSGFSEKSFFKRISKIWAKILNFSLNFWKKLDFIDFSMRVLERLNFQSGVMYIFSSNSWFWAIIKGFSEGLPLFKLKIFFLKSKRILIKNWYIVSPILDPAIHLHQIWHKLWEDSICGWPLEHTQTGIVFAYNIKTISYEHLIVCSVYISRLHGRKHKYAFCRMKHHWTRLLLDRYCSLGFFLAWNPLLIFRYTYSYKCWWQTLSRFWSVHVS